jgi:DNA-directed RNA polymerase specialized sigma subunit
MKSLHYKSYRKLIFKLARKWHSNLNIDMEDAVSLGNLAYVLALKTHQYNKGAFSTHLQNKIEGRYKNYYNEQKKKRVNTEEILDKIPYNNYIMELINSLSADALLVVKLVLNSPAELLDIISKKMDKKIIAKFLKINYGWNYNKINLVFAEIKEVL